MQSAHKVLVIGVGSIGERHLRCFQATGRAEVSLCDVNSELARAVAERYSVRAFADVDQALSGGIEAAVIATPAPWHVPQAALLAEAGVHVLIEKPLSTSLEGIDLLADTVRRRGVVAAVAYVHRAQPSLAVMREAILSGRFGEPVELVAVTGQHFPTYRPAYREIYYRQRATGGGAIQDALTHILNAGEWLLGPIERLVCDAEHVVLEGVEVEDTVHLLARHGTAMASYALNQHQAPNETTLTVVCRQGTARFEAHRHRWRWMLAAETPWHDEPAAPHERDTLYMDQANRFLDCVEGRAVPACTLDEGLQTLRVNLAALASLESGAWEVVG